MLNIGPQELLIILVIALIVVGPTRLPELGRSIGKGLREIRKAQDEVKRTIQVNIDEPAGVKDPKQRTRSPGRSPAAGTDTGVDDAAAVTAGPVARTGDPATPPAISPDPLPFAGAPPPASQVSEISRTLGRSLAELRRAREEVQRSFRVDLGEIPAPPSPARPAADPAPSGPPAGAEPP